MGNEGSDWIVYVAWKTIADWKQRTREAASAWGSTKAKPRQVRREFDEYPFQYASKQSRFMKMRQGHRLWLVSLPQFQGFCQPPSIMARLELEDVYDRMEGCPIEVSRHSDGFGRYLAVGKPGRAIDTYPPLYNVFDVLTDAEFEGRVKNLSKYRVWLDRGDFGDRGPYYRLAQHFRTLRQLTPESGNRLRAKHRIAVDGRRVFISYKRTDFSHRCVAASDNEDDWVKLLVASLEKAHVLVWWDKKQMRGPSRTWNKQAELIGSLLNDGVQQATWFVALGTNGYGSAGYSGRRWTLEEWETAGIEATNARRRGKLRRLLVEFGGSAVSARLPGKADETVRVAPDAGAEVVATEVAKVIFRLAHGT